MRDLILMLIVFGALPFALFRPQVGVLLWCWFSYMNPHRLTWGFAYDFPFAAVIGAATIAGVVFSKEPKRIPWTPLTVVWLLFVAWMSFTTIFALIPHDAYAEWSRAMKIQLMTFVTIMVMTTRERLRSLVWVIVLSLGFYGVKGGMFAAATGGNYMVYGPAGSFISGNNSLALALVMTVPLMRYLQLNTKSRFLRYALGVGMVLSALAILASYSRGAFLAISAMAFVMLLKSRKKVVILLALLVIVPAMLSFMPEKWFQRVETIETYQEDASAMGRINAWWFAFNIAKERPFVGGGYDVFDPELFRRYAPNPEDFHDVHSIYFEVLGEHGFVGLILFLMIGFLSLRACKWTIRQTRDRKDLYWARDLASMVHVSIIGYAVGGAFLGLAYFDLYYHLVSIALLTRVAVERALTAGATAGDESTAPGELQESGPPARIEYTRRGRVNPSAPPGLAPSDSPTRK